MYLLELSKPAIKHLSKIETRYKILISRSLDELQHQPRLGVPLNGKLKGFWKLRVANYRIIYQIIDLRLVIYIIDIDHRKQVYR